MRRRARTATAKPADGIAILTDSIEEWGLRRLDHPWRLGEPEPRRKLVTGFRGELAARDGADVVTGFDLALQHGPVALVLPHEVGSAVVAAAHSGGERRRHRKMPALVRPDLSTFGRIVRSSTSR
jgi:hypothetical protein